MRKPSKIDNFLLEASGITPDHRSYNLLGMLVNLAPGQDTAEWARLGAALARSSPDLGLDSNQVKALIDNPAAAARALRPWAIDVMRRIKTATATFAQTRTMVPEVPEAIAWGLRSARAPIRRRLRAVDWLDTHSINQTEPATV